MSRNWHMVILVSVLTTRRSDCCLPQQKKTTVSQRKHSCLREGTYRYRQQSHGQHLRGLLEGGKQNFMNSIIYKDDALSYQWHKQWPKLRLQIQRFFNEPWSKIWTFQPKQGITVHRSRGPPRRASDKIRPVPLSHSHKNKALSLLKQWPDFWLVEYTDGFLCVIHYT